MKTDTDDELQSRSHQKSTKNQKKQKKRSEKSGSKQKTDRGARRTKLITAICVMLILTIHNNYRSTHGVTLH